MLISGGEGSETVWTCPSLPQSRGTLRSTGGLCCVERVAGVASVWPKDKQRVAECLDIPGPHPPRPCSWPKRKRSSHTITRSRKRQVTQVPHPKGALYSHQEVKKKGQSQHCSNAETSCALALHPEVLASWHLEWHHPHNCNLSPAGKRRKKVTISGKSLLTY